MDDKISLSAPPPETEKIAILPSANPPVTDEEVLGSRSAKIDFALGEDSPGGPAIRSALLAGHETIMREQGALQEQIRLNDTRVNLVQDIFRRSNEQGRTLSKAEEQTIMGLTQADMNEAAVDPKTFFEKKYAQRVMDTAVSLGENNPFLEAAEQDDNAFFQKKHFQDILAKREIAQKLYDDAGKTSKSQSWAGYLADEAKTLVPLYTWYKMGNLDQNDKNDALPGNDKRATITYLYSLPPEQMAREARAIYDRLNKDNTVLAQEFAEALVGYSSTQQFIDNTLIPITDIASFIPIRPIARAIKGLASAAAKGGVTAATELSKKSVVETLNNSRRFLADFTLAMTKPRAGVDTALDAIGHNVQGALVSHYKQLQEMAGTGSKLASWDHMTKNIPSLFNLGEVTSMGGRYFGKKVAEGIRADLETGAESLIKKLLINPIRAQRLDGALLEAAAKEARETMELHLTNTNHAIIDARIVNPDNKLGTTSFSEVDIARQGGALFDTAAQADITAKIDYGLLPGSYKIQRRGNGHYLTVTRPVNELAPSYRQALKDIATKNAKPPGNRLTEWAMKWRTPDDTLADDIVRTLSVGTYGQAAMKQAIEDFINTIPKLDKDSADKLTQLMIQQQGERSRIDPTRLGNGSENLLEFGYDFFAKHGRAPTEKEAEAYFKMKQLNDIVYAASNITQFMERSRAGVSLWSFNYGDFVTGGIRDIEGRMVDDIPWEHSQNFGILVLREEKGIPGTPEVVGSHGAGRKPLKEREKLDPQLMKDLTQARMKKAERADVVTKALDILGRPIEKLPSKRDEIKELLAQGYQIIQVSHQGARSLVESPFAAATNVFHEKPDVRFIVAKSHRNAPLGFNILPYREGFRFQPPDSALFLRQAIVKKKDIEKEFVYYGDKNLYQLDNIKDAEVMRDRFEKARKLFLKATEKKSLAEKVVDSVKVMKPSFKELDLTEFNQYVRDNLPARVGDLGKKFFEGSQGREGLDPRSPILFSPTNQSLDRAHKLDAILNGEHGTTYKYRRLKDDDLDIYENTVTLQGAMERGDQFFKIANKGSVHNPIWEIDRADLMSPVQALENTAKSFVRSASMNDLTFQMSERFIAEFSDVLEPTMKELYHDPIQMLLDDSIFKKGLKNEQLTRLRQAQTYQQRAIAFLGLKSETSQLYAYHVDKLLGDIDHRFGQGVIFNTADWLLRKKDPITRLRTLAFHAKIGMLNFRQMILQPMTLASMAAVVGDMRIVDMTARAIWEMGIFRDRPIPELMKAASKNMRKSGWKEGWFEEAHDLLTRSGFDQVSQTHILVGDHMDFNVVKHGIDKALDHGTYFFQRGEKMVRHGAMMGAYLEWRLANPTAKLTDLQRAKILKRADLLNMNMSHASRARWQEGALSIPTQFLSYPIRTFEQMIGKRLTWKEKGRIVAVHSALFGTPVALSGAVQVWPVHEEIKEQLLSAGVDVNANVIATIINDGFLGMMAETFAGEPTNFSERFGPSGIPTLKDLFDGDKTPWDVLSGAAGSTFVGLVMNAAPVLPWLADAITPGKEAPISITAIKDATLGQITTWSNLEKGFMALTTGAYYSKRGVKIDDDANAVQAFFTMALGYEPKRVNLMYDLQKVMKARQDVQQKLRPTMLKDLRNTLSSTNVGDATTSLTDFRARAIAGGFTPGQVNEMVRTELKGKEALWDQMKTFSKIDKEKNDFVQAMKAKYKGTQ